MDQRCHGMGVIAIVAEQIPPLEVFTAGPGWLKLGDDIFTLGRRCRLDKNRITLPLPPRRMHLGLGSDSIAVRNSNIDPRRPRARLSAVAC